MGKLYLKQKVFSFKDRATVKDEREQDRYEIEGKIFSIGKNLTIRDMSGREVAILKQKVVTLMPKFFITMGGRQVAEIKKKFTLLHPKYLIEGPGWEVEGNFTEHDYSIKASGKEVARVHKAWISWGDSYEITIQTGVDEVLVLATVLAIDAVLDSQSASAATANAD